MKERPTPAEILAYLEGMLEKLGDAGTRERRHPDRDAALAAARTLGAELRGANPAEPVTVAQEERFRELERWERAILGPQATPEA